MRRFALAVLLAIALLAALAYVALRYVVDAAQAVMRKARSAWRRLRRPKWRIEDGLDGWDLVAWTGERFPGASGGRQFMDRSRTERRVRELNLLRTDDDKVNVAPFGKPIICRPDSGKVERP